MDEIRKLALPACREFDVSRLDAFGSVVRGMSGALNDLDFLVEFKDPDRSPAKRFFGLLHYLEDVLRCPVDLLTIGSLKNPYFKRHVLEEIVPIYEG